MSIIVISLLNCQLFEDLDETQLIDLQDRNRQVVPMKILKKVAIKSWDDITKKTWRIGQVGHFNSVFFLFFLNNHKHSKVIAFLFVFDYSFCLRLVILPKR